MGVFKTTTRTAVTEWIERMTSERYNEDDYDDIFELCEVINIQVTGPKEACKALKRALKYGNVHSQIRAITVLKSLTENCGEKFVAQISMHKFTDRLRSMAASQYTDPKVQKKLLSLFADWSTEFKNKPGYETLANLHNSATHVTHRGSTNNAGLTVNTRRGPSSSNVHNKEKNKNESTSRQSNKEKNKNESTSRQSKKGQQSERQLTYSSEKINEAIGLATQNATNLINALTLLSPGSDLKNDADLQELVRKCKTSSELLVKIIPTATDGNQLGPLLQSNDQVQGALDIYSEYNEPDKEVNDITSGMKDIKLQKTKENDKKKQSEEAAKIHKDFGDLIDFDAFSSNITSNHTIDNNNDTAYADPFADPFADPVTPSRTPEPETVNESKRRLEWAEV